MNYRHTDEGNVVIVSIFGVITIIFPSYMLLPIILLIYILLKG